MVTSMTMKYTKTPRVRKVTYSPCAKSVPMPVFIIKVYRNTATFIHLSVFYDCFHTVTEQFSSCDTEDIFHKNETISIWPFTEKYF